MRAFFVRGGLAAGDLYMDNDIVFGTGLIDAYEAEKNAGTPRVVLAKSAVDLVERHIQYYMSVEASPHDRMLLVDEDDKIIINYLDCAWPNRTEPPYFDWFQQHRDILIDRLARHQSESHLWAKYAWVARYHNYSCDVIPVEDDCKLDVSLLPLRPKRLQDVYTHKGRSESG